MVLKNSLVFFSGAVIFLFGYFLVSAQSLEPYCKDGYYEIPNEPICSRAPNCDGYGYDKTAELPYPNPQACMGDGNNRFGCDGWVPLCCYEVARTGDFTKCVGYWERLWCSPYQCDAARDNGASDDQCGGSCMCGHAFKSYCGKRPALPLEDRLSGKYSYGTRINLPTPTAVPTPTLTLAPTQAPIPTESRPYVTVVYSIPTLTPVPTEVFYGLNPTPTQLTIQPTSTPTPTPAKKTSGIPSWFFDQDQQQAGSSPKLSPTPVKNTKKPRRSLLEYLKQRKEKVNVSLKIDYKVVAPVDAGINKVQEAKDAAISFDKKIANRIDNYIKELIFKFLPENIIFFLK
ncbi:MAG: hypothetical protein KatS3mg091_228 [Patescibacteria group bacterium]|nr:MAG: hypothetical protein KatS3mg091_228 [Patescibacteria group bacterium]